MNNFQPQPPPRNLKPTMNINVNPPNPTKRPHPPQSTPHHHDNLHWNTQQKALATILFDTQLTPIIRRLLLLQELRQQQQLSCGGLEMERLKQTKQLVVRLRSSLDVIHKNVDAAANPANKISMMEHDVHCKLLNQINGISLPLINLLQYKDSTISGSVARSAHYGNVEEAALSLVSLWKCISRIHDSSCIHSLVLPILMGCAMALSCLEVSCDDAKVSEDAEEKKSNLCMEGALDRGEDCALAVLRLIRTILDDATYEQGLDKYQNDHGNKSFANLISQHVGNAMGGSLVARLVLSCLSLLNQESNIVSNNDNVAIRAKENSAMLQLKSLKTLRVIMEGVPRQGLWRSVLPGCFAGLYRSALANLRYISAASAHKVASGSISAAALLLKLSLTLPISEATSKEEREQSVISSLLKAVNRAKQTTATNVTGHATSPPDSSDVFINEVNNRLPAPLSVLLSMIPANRSRLVRKSGLDLCQVVLIDAWHVWEESNANSLGRKAFEYCLTMLSDNNEELQKCSRQLLTSYKSHIGNESWKLRLSKSIVPTILELIEILPILAKSGRDAEVCNHLRLINGYLLISFRNMENEFDAGECLEKKRKSDIGSALGCPEAIDVIKKSFGVLFIPDVNTIMVKPMIETGLSSDLNQLACIENRSFRSLYLKDETIDMAQHTVHLIACALGAKRSAFAIDGCFAGVFQSCVKSIDHNDDGASIGIELDRRLDWCGCCIFANEILTGVTSRCGKPTEANVSSSDRRILTSLASAVLPVAVSHPLWTLPTSLPDSNFRTNNDTSQTPMSTCIMRSNSVLVCTLMKFIGGCAKCLQEDMRMNLTTILLPMLERASAIGNHSTVQSCAFETILSVALSSGYANISVLLKDNFDYIMDQISLQLRRHSKERTPASRSLMGVSDVVLRHVVQNDCVEPDHVPIVYHTLDCAFNHFDRLNNPRLSQIQLLDSICVFQSINAFMELSIKARTRAKAILSLDSEPVESWKERLDIDLDTILRGHNDDIDDQNHFIQNDITDSTDSNEEPPLHTNVERSNSDEDSTFSKEILAINGISRRCTYLLCHSDLRVQVLCIETILSGFRSLGEIGTYNKSLRGEAADNPLLPAIAEHWPSILPRLRETASNLHSKKTMSRAELSIRHMMAENQEYSPSNASLIVLLTKLLGIVSELCTISDGFFAGRFETDVYPLLAILLGDTIPDEMKSAAKYSSLPERRYTRLDPILQCLKCVFQSSCKDALAGLISSCGTILLPLLAHTGQLGDQVFVVLKTMIQVDCDVLWQPIHRLSGRPFPLSPFVCCGDSKSKNRDDCNIVASRPSLRSKTTCCGTIMAKRANDLLEFIEELPEQDI